MDTMGTYGLMCCSGGMEMMDLQIPKGMYKIYNNSKEMDGTRYSTGRSFIVTLLRQVLYIAVTNVKTLFHSSLILLKLFYFSSIIAKLEISYHFAS